MRVAGSTIACSLASLPFILPHVIEDFGEGMAARFGFSTGVLAFLLGGYVGVQALGLVLIGLRRRVGWIITVGVGVIWVAGAGIDHGPAIFAGPFRSGTMSVLWVVGLIVTQTAALLLAAVGLRAASRGHSSRRYPNADCPSRRVAELAERPPSGH